MNVEAKWKGSVELLLQHRCVVGPHSHDEGKGKSRAIVGNIMSAPYRYAIGSYCTMLAYKGVHRWCL